MWEEQGRGEVYTWFWCGNLSEEHLEELDVDGSIILKLFFKFCDGGVVWVDLAQDRDKWRAVVNAVMNIWVP